VVYHADLVAAVVAGSAQAFAVVYDAHAAEVLTFCRRRCLVPAEAEDLLSVVFLEAWRNHAKAVTVDGTLRPWLYGIATNVLRNASRSRRRHNAALQRYRTSTEELLHPDHADAVATAVTAAGSRRHLAAAFAQLSVKERDVADLVLVEGLDIAAAATALGITPATAKSRLAEARRRLQRLLRTSDLTLLHDPSGHQPVERPTTASVPRSTAS
jgi:RNA polymerase sigma factor (sigma-70 family)